MRTIDDLKLEQIASVYVGEAGKCCCGCSGMHHYASSHRDWASTHRGYAVTDDEVNDAEVKKVFHLLNAHACTKAVEFDGDLVMATAGETLFIAYLVH